VFAITGLGMLPLYVYRLDLSKLTSRPTHKPAFML